MNDQEIENEIQAKGLTAQRVTMESVEANIDSEHYFSAAHGVLCSGTYMTSNPPSLGLLDFCVLVLRNGFPVTGESFCDNPENYDREIGRKIARQNAIAKVWQLMGYELKSKLSQA